MEARKIKTYWLYIYLSYYRINACYLAWYVCLREIGVRILFYNVTKHEI